MFFFVSNLFYMIPLLLILIQYFEVLESFVSKFVLFSIIPSKLQTPAVQSNSTEYGMRVLQPNSFPFTRGDLGKHFGRSCVYYEEHL